MIRKSTKTAVLAALFLTNFSHADVTPNKLFQDNMVLQRDKPIAIWGTADPQEVVHVSIAGTSASGTADDNGKWMVYLDPISAGGPYELTFEANNTVTLSNILMGDVYLGSGQSNMDRTISTEVVDVRGTLANANVPGIRLLNLSRNGADTPQEEISRATWTLCDSETAEGFSALLYFFGLDLYQNTGVPIGLIRCAVGGSYIRSWHPELNAEFYNGMVAPLMPFTLNGILWYQGESDAGYIPQSTAWGERYAEMIQLWRDGFMQPGLPFFCTQLASFEWLYLSNVREGQYNSMRLPNSGCTTAIDAGDTKDIHPKTKEIMGPRFGLWVRKFLYGHDVPFTGPLWKSATRVDDSIEVEFAYVGSGLVCKGDSLEGFQIAGSNERYFDATAEIISSHTLRIHSSSVFNPEWVRYAWASDPPVTLYGGDNLPAPSFRAKAGTTGPMPSFNPDLINTKLPPSTLPPDPIPEGEAVLNLHFNEGSGTTTKDSSGFGNDGTISNAEWISGQDGSALHFDSSDDRLDCAGTTSLNPDSFTAAAWIKLDSTGSYMNIMSRMSSDGWKFSVNRSSNSVLFFAWYNNEGGTEIFKGITPLAADIWYHVAVVVNNGGTITFYLDGIPDGAKTMTSRFSYPDAPLVIGNTDTGWYGGHFQGVIDNALLYSSVLTADQVADLAAGIPPTTPFEAWANRFGGTAIIGSPSDDHDGDGINNLMEFALDGNPTLATDGGNAPSFILEGDTIRFTHPLHRESGLFYVVESSSSLQPGSWSPALTNRQETLPVSGKPDFLKVSNWIPTGSNAKFVRLRIF